MPNPFVLFAAYSLYSFPCSPLPPSPPNPNTPTTSTPNEKMSLTNFFRGIETVIRFLAEYAT